MVETQPTATRITVYEKLTILTLIMVNNYFQWEFGEKLPTGKSQDDEKLLAWVEKRRLAVHGHTIHGRFARLRDCGWRLHGDLIHVDTGSGASLYLPELPDRR